MQYLVFHAAKFIQVEKAKIGGRLWIGWIESFVGQLRSLVNSVRWSSEIRFGDVKCGKLLHYKDTIHRRNKRPILRYFLTMMLMFKEWSKEKVKTRTARSRAIENRSIRDIS
ncbi:hypothetical protein T03_14055 [Trichinella britovi]|uniref:Uncharacterized protein n=1 Tax=Trichinella britovi TaxID=45882 RepID=A0A0V1D1N4_TRIBR|nr:hypothetical protein T03_14055 [Trichinella britovi]